LFFFYIKNEETCNLFIFKKITIFVGEVEAGKPFSIGKWVGV